MTILFDIDNFEIKEFYSYPTTVIDRIVEYDTGFHANSPDNVEDVKDLFTELLKITENKLGKTSLMDNKIAMKIVYKPTNTTFFIGYKDWNWSLGLALNPYMTGRKTIINN